MKLWIARRKSNKLYMFFEKPHLADGKQWFVLENVPNNGVFANTGIKIDENEFQDVSYENSPQEVELKLVNEL